jgi:hypothetical protein
MAPGEGGEIAPVRTHSTLLLLSVMQMFNIVFTGQGWANCINHKNNQPNHSYFPIEMYVRAVSTVFGLQPIHNESSP